MLIAPSTLAAAIIEYCLRTALKSSFLGFFWAILFLYLSSFYLVSGVSLDGGSLQFVLFTKHHGMEPRGLFRFLFLLLVLFSSKLAWL